MNIYLDIFINNLYNKIKNTQNRGGKMRIVYVLCIKGSSSYLESNTDDFLYVCETKETANKQKEIYQTKYPDTELVIYEETLY